MIKVGVLTLSDSGAAGERKDESGPVIEKAVQEIDGQVDYYQVLPDNKKMIIDELHKMAVDLKLHLILTTGGTGLAPTDVTPDATKEVIEKEVPGIPETMRAESLKKTRKAMLSRAVAGVKGESLIINLPGSPKAVQECLEVILEVIPHAVELLQDEVEDCARE
ncbi:MogA/MoaB family molybdenum cofactor biosynthesis protein [Halanaerobacter jeridensis]|uniref:Molybdenum cofactor synthesis domain-containing protein n=1 Tax=Halanaerobacter jeridensis TaxID=706427 RepID=A0A938XQM6_9FIRM|nr:MogA/MoaB family molybdenum cofactor biosynthesis protein [Halanaerobacter jeridensis]MBM7557667.1 molybdenum cofactor synthesis domain-containing protein [Halanaerobacter jeridensis]